MSILSRAFYISRAANLNKVEQPDLSPREREVFQWVARGRRSSIIEEIIGISPNTVDTHLRRIYTKLNVKDRTTAAIQGIGAGLIH
ncbi:MAG: helix-turn-helix transcriptional regulator [Pseudomonadota bacterium]